MSVVRDIEKWIRNNAPNADVAQRLLLTRAYCAGRNKLVDDQKRRARLEAQRKRLTARE